MNIFHPLTRACWLLCICSFAGCGGNDAERATVTVAGEVTLDGQPLPEGDIVFEPVDASDAPEGGKVTAGNFSCQAPAGSHIIRITAMKETGENETGAMGESIKATEQYLPARFNEESEIKAEVPPEGKLDFKFELKSK